MDYFILEIPWISHIMISTSYGFTIIKSNFCNRTIQYISYFPINTTLLYHYMKNLLPNIYLLNKVKMLISIKLEDIQILKSRFKMTMVI